MENQIVQQLGMQLERLLPEVQREIKSLKDFAIFSGAALKVKAPEGLKELVDAKSWYITMKFDGSATREDAKRVFQYTMVDKLGLPSTEDLDDEILPKREYPAATAPSDAPQLPAPDPNTKSDVIDIDDEGNVKQDLVAKTPLAVAPTSRYYAVEFKVIGAPTTGGHLGGPRGNQRIGRRSWAPHRLGVAR